MDAARDYYLRNAEAEKLRSREWYQANRKRALSVQKAYVDRNREKTAEYKRSWYLANRDVISKIRADYWAINKSIVQARFAKWKKKNYEILKVKNSAYYRRNKDRYAEHSATRRARKNSAPGRHTKKQIDLLFALQKRKCACCRASLRGGFHKDHIEPLSRGGSNDILNIQLLCARCNLSKHAKDPIRFMQERGFLL